MLADQLAVEEHPRAVAGLVDLQPGDGRQRAVDLERAAIPERLAVLAALARAHLLKGRLGHVDQPRHGHADGRTLAGRSVERPSAICQVPSSETTWPRRRAAAASGQRQHRPGRVTADGSIVRISQQCAAVDHGRILAIPWPEARATGTMLDGRGDKTPAAATCVQVVSRCAGV